MTDRNPLSTLINTVLGHDAGKETTASTPAEPMSLDKTIKTRFAPTLRSDGFTGSGRTFRRVVDGVICILHIQGSRWGGSFCVELGLQPMSIPGVLDVRPDPKKLTIIQCEFRRRLTIDSPDQWWPYTDRKSLDAAVHDACEVYKTAGRSFFAAHTGPDAPLLTVTADEFAAGPTELSGFMTTEVRMARTIALMRLAAGHREEAKAFAELALARMGSALGLKRELEDIVTGTWTPSK